MKLKNDKKILIVGLGLLGGSYARALTEKGFYVSAITRSDSSIEYALREGIIAAGSTKIDEKLIGEADVSYNICIIVIIHHTATVSVIIF